MSAILPVTPSESIEVPFHQLKRNKCKNLKAEAILLQLFVFLLIIFFFSMGERESEYLGKPICSLCKTQDLYFTTSVLLIPYEDRTPKKRFFSKYNIFICLQIYSEALATIAWYSTDFKATSSQMYYIKQNQENKMPSELYF